MKILTGVLISTLLLAATPAMADRGFNNHRDHRDHWKQDRHARHFNHRGPHHRPVVRRTVHHYYETQRPEPAYYSSPSQVGINVVFPNIFIPFN